MCFGIQTLFVNSFFIYYGAILILYILIIWISTLIFNLKDKKKIIGKMEKKKIQTDTTSK